MCMKEGAAIKIENGIVQVIHDGKPVYEVQVDDMARAAMYGPVSMSVHMEVLSVHNRNLPTEIFYEFAKVIYEHDPASKIDWLQTMFNVELKQYTDKVHEIQLSYLVEADLKDLDKYNKLKKEAEDVMPITVATLAKKANYTLVKYGLPFFGKEEAEKAKTAIKE